jgi:hypothetical protein
MNGVSPKNRLQPVPFFSPDHSCPGGLGWQIGLDGQTYS